MRFDFDNPVVFIGTFMASALLIAGVLVGGILYTVPIFKAPFDQRQCARYGASTARTVQFRRWSHWSWDCFVKLEDGTWVSKSQIRGISS